MSKANITTNLALTRAIPVDRMAKKINTKKAFGANIDQYEHASTDLGCNMQFSVIDPTPVYGSGTKFPVIYWLSGLTCSDRSGQFRYAIGGFADLNGGD